MYRRFAVMLALLVSCLASGPAVPPVHAAEPGLHLYVFGSEHCVHCQRAVDYLRRLRVADGRFRLQEYDIERSTEEAELFVRVLLDIGLREPVIPMVIIGPHILLGFDTDETSGPAIKKFIEACVTAACPDFVVELDATAPASNVKRPWRLEHRWTTEAARRR